MRLPAVAIAAAFACGIVFGLHPAAAHDASSVVLLITSLFVAALLVVVGIILVKLGRLFPAAAEIGRAHV